MELSQIPGVPIDQGNVCGCETDRNASPCINGSFCRALHMMHEAIDTFQWKCSWCRLNFWPEWMKGSASWIDLVQDFRLPLRPSSLRECPPKCRSLLDFAAVSGEFYFRARLPTRRRASLGTARQILRFRWSKYCGSKQTKTSAQDSTVDGLSLAESHQVSEMLHKSCESNGTAIQYQNIRLVYLQTKRILKLFVVAKRHLNKNTWPEIDPRITRSVLCPIYRPKRSWVPFQWFHLLRLPRRTRYLLVDGHFVRVQPRSRNDIFNSDRGIASHTFVFGVFVLLAQS